MITRLGRLSSSSLVRDGAWTVGALVLPALSALVLLPVWSIVIHPFRMGVLLVVVAVLASANFIDLGIGRALTKAIANSRSRGEAAMTSALALTGVKLSSCVAVLVGGLVIGYLTVRADLLVDGAQSALGSSEVAWCPTLIALAVAGTILSGGLRGIAEGFQLFRTVALVRTFVGVSTFAVPAALAIYSDSLVLSLLGLIVIRVISTCCFIIAVVQHIQFRTTRFRSVLVARQYRPLLSTSIWLSLSNVALVVFFVYDRVFVADVFGAELVTFYATPLEIVSKLTAVTGALSIVLFPRFASESSESVRRARRVAVFCLLGFGIPAFFAALGSVFYATELLSVWLDKEFADFAKHSFSWQIFTSYVTAMSVVLYGYAQARGFGKAVALSQLAQAVAFVLFLQFVDSSSNIAAVAALCFFRALIDFLILVCVFVGDRNPGPTSR